MNLFEIDSALCMAMERARIFAEAHDGEIPEEIGKELDAIEDLKVNKIQNCIKYFKNEDAIAQAISKEMEVMKKRVSSHVKAAEWMKNYIAANSIGETYEFPCGKLFWRESTRTVIEDESAFPEDFYKIEKQLMVKKVKEALEQGISLPAHLEKKQNIQIK